MSQWTPSKRRDFIRRLRTLGFAGPFSGRRHQFMRLNRQRITVPSNEEFPVPQLRMLLKQVEFVLGREIAADEWNGL